MDLWILSVLAIAGVAGTVEVHFENKDGGFFLKHTARQYYPAVVDLAGTSGSSASPRDSNASPSSNPSSSILSVDRFTILQTSQPISIRATYGPFSTKQTVPARYIVPDPLDALPLPEKTQHGSVSNTSSSSVLLDMDVTTSSSHHLDMSAHIVRGEIPRDSPVLRVLFHTGSDAGGRRLMSHHQRVCIILHASMAEKTPLTAACSPDGEDGVCLAQVTIPASWWAPLPPPDVSGRGGKPLKTPQRMVQVAYSVLEPRVAGEGKDDGGCVPRVQIQPVTQLALVPLIPARSAYRELRSDEMLTLLVPHVPLYPLSRLHIPVFLQPRTDFPISAFVIRARVKSGLRLLGADPSSDQWNVSVDLNPKHTVATVTAYRKENQAAPAAAATGHGQPRIEEVFSWLLEVVEDSSDLWDGGRIVWSVRYIMEGADASSVTRANGRTHHAHDAEHRPQKDGLLEETRRKITARLEIQKDDIQAVLPISKNWEVMNTAVLTGRQVSQAMKVFIVSQAGKVADVTLQSSCHSEDESVIKVSSSCSSVYVDGSEIRGSSNASVLVKYGTYTGLAKYTVWMPEFPLEVNVADFRLSQVKGWKVPDDPASVKIRRSVEAANGNRETSSRGWTNAGTITDEAVNRIEQEKQASCRLRFQQSPVEIYARFSATDHDSGRVSYFVSRRTWLRVTDLVLSLLRVADPRIASLHGRILQGRSMGRTEVQVLSPITGRVIGAKEIRVGNDKVSISRLQVRVVSGLQLSIVPDTTVENGYIAETLVTRRLTAQYQEGLLDIDLEFSDGSRTPLRDVAVSDYYLLVNSLDPDIVAFAPMVASHHPRVIAVGEGRGDLLRVSVLSAEDCHATQRKNGGKSGNAGPLAATSAAVDVDFTASEVPQRPEFVQNDGGNVGGGYNNRDRKNNREMATDLHDILIGIPLKDENNHEPTVQARQHHSAVANGMGGVGIRHHNNMHMTPLEIGMYVLLAAFCFAIVVFVVSCVVYASKFKPQTLESPIGAAGANGNGGQGLGAAVSRVTSAGIGLVGPNGKKQGRESTTNAHDWVWLGRATLERASGHLVMGGNVLSSGRSPPIINNNNINNKDQQHMHITSNPMNPGDMMDEDEVNLGACFDNPHHIDLPSKMPAIDSATYCKKEKLGRHNGGGRMKGPYQALGMNQESAPPPLPPHGAVLGQPNGAAVEDDEYKPPVPPHRNIGVTARIGPGKKPAATQPGFLTQQQLTENATAWAPHAQAPRRHHHHHHHHRNSNNINNHRSSKGHHHQAKPPDLGEVVNVGQEVVEELRQLRNQQKIHSREDIMYDLAREPAFNVDDEENLPNDTFVEYPLEGVASNGNAVNPEVKRATIVGNPMFSDAEEDDGVAEMDSRVQEELIGLEDLNLGMDYDQIMEYFDNLKESNA